MRQCFSRLTPPLLVAGHRSRPSPSKRSSSASRRSRRAHLPAPLRYRELRLLSPHSAVSRLEPTLPWVACLARLGMSCDAWHIDMVLEPRGWQRARVRRLNLTPCALVCGRKSVFGQRATSGAPLPQCSHQSGCRSCSSRSGPPRQHPDPTGNSATSQCVNEKQSGVCHTRGYYTPYNKEIA